MGESKITQEAALLGPMSLMASTNSRSPDEQENDNGNSDYVSKGYSAQLEREFDDLVVWISPHILKNRIVKGGKLP